MIIEEKITPQILITGLKDLDPIRVWLDEKQEKHKGGLIKYSAHIVILCYGVALNYYWESMGMPLKEFFVNCHTEYIANKFRINARETYRPKAFEAVLDEETNEITEVENSDVRLEMADFHEKYICLIIEAVKAAFTQLKAHEVKK